MPCVLLALKSGAGSRMRGMRDSMAVVMFSPRGNSGEQWAFGASFPGVVFKHEGTRGGGRAAGECLSYVRIRRLRVELGTHPQRAAATAAATEGAGMVRGGCHVSSGKQRS